MVESGVGIRHRVLNHIQSTRAIFVASANTVSPSVAFTFIDSPRFRFGVEIFRNLIAEQRQVKALALNGDGA